MGLTVVAVQLSKCKGVLALIQACPAYGHPQKVKVHAGEGDAVIGSSATVVWPFGKPRKLSHMMLNSA